MGGGGSTPEAFDRDASTKRAFLVRDQWRDYKQRFQPVENQIINDMGSGVHTRFNQEGIDTARKAVDTAYAGAKSMESRDRERMGMGLSDAQKAVQSTQMNTQKSAASANAVNTANQWDIDRRNAVVSGGLGNASTMGRG
jgi:macrodomain Ter protein organizer (MatP/YcbG family)